MVAWAGDTRQLLPTSAFGDLRPDGRSSPKRQVLNGAAVRKSGARSAAFGLMRTTYAWSDQLNWKRFNSVTVLPSNSNNSIAVSFPAVRNGSNSLAIRSASSMRSNAATVT